MPALARAFTTAVMVTRLLKSLRRRLPRDAPEDDAVVNGPRVRELLSLRVAMFARLIHSGLKRLLTLQNTPSQCTADADAVGPWANLFGRPARSKCSPSLT